MMKTKRTTIKFKPRSRISARFSKRKPKFAKRAEISLRGKEITCAFCKGKGKDPFEVPSKLSRCQACSGRGKFSIADIPHEKCWACKGTGVFAHHRLVCSVCKGRGIVPKDKRRKGKKGLGPDTGLPEIGCY